MNKTLSLMRRPLAIAAVTGVALSLSIPLGAAAVEPSQSSFGRMFPTLAGFTSPTDTSLAVLADSMLDPGLARLDNEATPAGFTYFGQFIDHDLTLNVAPLPSTSLDPTTLKNFRTARFDLDSVYGGGPTNSPQLYQADGKSLLVQDANVNGVPDLPRNPNGSAIIGEGRNDENAIIAQLHLAVLKFHNRLIEEGASFKDAQRLTQWHYQWVVVNDYLPHVVGQDRVDRFLHGRSVSQELYKPGDPAAPMTPTEFSTAIFRYGHSQVRDSYEMNDASEDAPIKVFSGTAEQDLQGGRPLTESLEIAWNEFFEIDGFPAFEGNVSRKLDTRISESLFKLPMPSVVPEHTTGILGQRNLIRAKRYGIPSGQDVASKMGIPAISNSRLGLGGSQYKSFNGEAPLWYYMLAESELNEGGARLGEVGGRIIAEVFLRQMKIDPASYLNAKKAFSPTVEHEGAFTIGDFLKFAGVAEVEEVPAP